ncbi:DUF881 domain-containing protein [Blastococcus xanthinilyticus]|uniref:Uncharacterized protein YlxW (UPF0749 family) n=1 Tax=Blastococcus xanthinilyticus TaxID=1564164 RepID=A0A5S5CZI5_9ACTN|nr:DUF881 domain-containing protein [Blastococcus xanthinilyticus]TYP89177.1 uncharacterized protein YlxW (UPF0749 family) [Blastococcus xanthinilyticus]
MSDPEGPVPTGPAGRPPGGDGTPPPADDGTAPPGAGTASARRRRDRLAAALIGVLTLLLGFALAVQVRNADEAQLLAGAREEDLVRILDELGSREDRLREQIFEQRAALRELTGSGSRTGTALEEARSRAEALGILAGSLPAQGPGITLTVRDPSREVEASNLVDVIQELRGAGAETMQVDDVRIGPSSAISGTAGRLRVDGTPLQAPYDFVVLGEPQDMETAMNIPGGIVQTIERIGGDVEIAQSPALVVDALRPLDRPQYASPATGD